MLNSAAVREHALALGFDRCGVAPVGPFPELAFLESWLRRGHAGTMTYLARSAKKRREVRAAEPTAQSVIVTATVYNTDKPHTAERTGPLDAIVSRYAWGDDYHVLVRQRLDALADWMRITHPEPFDARCYVDTGPIQERVYAQYAGIGWIGKNACLISPELGSWVFLGCLITSLPLEPDATPGVDQCGECTACLSACPTGALVAPHELDATRCLSYLTIEQRKSIPEALRPAMGRLDLRMRHLPGRLSLEPPRGGVRRAGVAAARRVRSRGCARALADERRAADVAHRGHADDACRRGAIAPQPRRRVGQRGRPVHADDLDGESDPARPSVADPVVAEHVPGRGRV